MYCLSTTCTLDIFWIFYFRDSYRFLYFCPFGWKIIF
jgi:hypothetical protein